MQTHQTAERPSYGVEEVLDPRQVSELRVPQENLESGKTAKELCDSQVEESDV